MLLETLIALGPPAPAARFISFIARSEHRHSTSLPLAEAVALGTLVATHWNDLPLPPDHGGPVRTIVPERYFYKSLKWLERIELLEEDRLGFWEGAAGYHNVADPWREQRYIAADIDPRQVRAILAARSVFGRELLGLDVTGLDLAGFDARDAVLRNGRFDRTGLAGVDFCGANLSDADFRGASLFGATFTTPPGTVPLQAARHPPEPGSTMSHSGLSKSRPTSLTSSAAPAPSPDLGSSAVGAARPLPTPESGRNGKRPSGRFRRSPIFSQGPVACFARCGWTMAFPKDYKG